MEHWWHRSKNKIEATKIIGHPRGLGPQRNKIKYLVMYPHCGDGKPNAALQRRLQKLWEVPGPIPIEVLDAASLGDENFVFVVGC